MITKYTQPQILAETMCEAVTFQRLLLPVLTTMDALVYINARADSLSKIDPEFDRVQFILDCTIASESGLVQEAREVIEDENERHCVLESIDAAKRWEALLTKRATDKANAEQIATLERMRLAR